MEAWRAALLRARGFDSSHGAVVGGIGKSRWTDCVRPAAAARLGRESTADVAVHELVRAIHDWELWRDEDCLPWVGPVIAAAVASHGGGKDVDAEAVAALAALFGVWATRWRDASACVVQAGRDAQSACARLGALVRRRADWTQERLMLKGIVYDLNHADDFQRHRNLDWPYRLRVSNRATRIDDTDETDWEGDPNDSDGSSSGGDGGGGGDDDRMDAAAEGADDDAEDDDDDADDSGKERGGHAAAGGADEAAMDVDPAAAERSGSASKAALRRAAAEKAIAAARLQARLARRRFREIVIDIVVPSRLLLRVWDDIATATLEAGSDRLWLPALAAAAGPALDTVPVQHRARRAAQLGDAATLAQTLAHVAALWSTPARAPATTDDHDGDGDNDHENEGEGDDGDGRIAELHESLLRMAVDFGRLDTLHALLVRDDASRAEAANALLRKALAVHSLACLWKATALGARPTVADLLGGRGSTSAAAERPDSAGAAFDDDVIAAVVADMRVPAPADASARPDSDLVQAIVRDVSVQACSTYDGLLAISLPSLLERVIRDWPADWPLPKGSTAALLQLRRPDLLQVVWSRRLSEAIDSYTPSVLETPPNSNVDARSGTALLPDLAVTAAALITVPDAMDMVLDAAAALDVPEWKPAFKVLVRAIVCANVAAVRTLLVRARVEVHVPSSDRLWTYACHSHASDDGRLDTGVLTDAEADASHRGDVIRLLVRAGLRVQPRDILQAVRTGVVASTAVAEMLGACRPPLSPMVLDAVIGDLPKGLTSLPVARVLWDAGADPLGPDGMFLHAAVAGSPSAVVAAMLERRALSRHVPPSELAGVLDRAYEIALMNKLVDTANLLAAAGASPLAWSDPARRYGGVSPHRRRRHVEDIGSVGATHPLTSFYRTLVSMVWPAHGVTSVPPVGPVHRVWSWADVDHADPAKVSTQDLATILRYDYQSTTDQPRIILGNVLSLSPRSCFRENDPILPLIWSHLRPLPAFTAELGVAICQIVNGSTASTAGQLGRLLELVPEADRYKVPTNKQGGVGWDGNDQRGGGGMRGGGK